jgi:glutaminyl-tRNA synthetase
LRYAYFITCIDIVKDPYTGDILELHCTYDPETKGGDAPDGRKVKATLHWVSAAHAIEAKVRLYDHLFTAENPMDVKEGSDFTESLNPDSLEELTLCRLEPCLKDAENGMGYQFERLGYFCIDAEDSTPETPVFNRTVNLRDTWGKIQKSQKK